MSTLDYINREQTFFGRMINRADDALCIAGAAMTFSKENVSAAVRSGRELRKIAAVKPEKYSWHRQPETLDARGAERDRQGQLDFDEQSRRALNHYAKFVDGKVIDTGKPAPRRESENER